MAILRRTLGERDIGHLGTLDPAADGLMVAAVGSKGLKVVELFNRLPKQYTATIELGAVSTTYDAEGMITPVTPKAGWLPPEDSSRIQALIDDRFLGKISQVPPIYSAVHTGGERAYRKAMRGETPELKAREAMISDCRVLEYKFPMLRLSVSCSSGTYIRSLANDLGEGMRCGAYLSALTRVRVGDWELENAVTAEDAKWTDIVPLKDILMLFKGVVLTEAMWKELQFGRSILGTMPAEGVLIGWYEDLPVVMLEANKKREGMLKPRKVF